VFLDRYKMTFNPGVSSFKYALWYFLISPIFKSRFIVFSEWRVLILRLLGAKVGKSVVIKPGVKIKLPWQLSIGDFSWIGEQAWIDNIAPIEIGSNVCISQGAYLCSGSHDWNSPTFDLQLKPIKIHDHVWLAAFSTVAPGTIVQEGVVLTMGANANGTLEQWQIYSGNPCYSVSERPRNKL